MSSTTKGKKTIDARKHSSAVEKNFVATNSSRNYIDKIINFSLYLFDNAPEFLEERIIPQMKELKKKDDEIFKKKMEKYESKIKSNEILREKKKQQGERVNNKKIKDPKIPEDTHFNLRKYIRELVKDIKPVEKDGDKHNSPIKIDGDGMITYSIIKDYMTTKKNIVIAERGCAEKYLAKIGKEAREEYDITIDDDDVDENGMVKIYTHQSSSQYSGIRSGIAYLYKLACIKMPDDLSSRLSKYIAGMDRTILTEKEQLGLSLSEGKKPMSVDAFELLAETLFRSKDKRDIFAHLFLVLDWNLMKRAENCVNAQINHIYFESDCLIFEFAKSKGKQKGEQHLGPWHVYANPLKPHICPVLALARYIFTYPDVLKGNAPLFEGTSQYSRYLQRFHRLLEELEDELKELGYEKGDLGTHSVRKGVGTSVAAGSTVSPPIVSLCIRAGWSLGGVKDRYLFREKAGDQYVGRCATGLDQNSKEFSVSCPYFDFTAFSNSVEKLSQKEKLKQLMKERLPYYGNMHGKTRHLATMCFASICFHHNHLETILHEECPLRASPMFRDIPDTIASLAQIAYPWNSTADTPKFTGVPPHVLLMAEMEEVKIELRNVKEKMIAELKSAMDERGFASHEHNTQKIIDALAQHTESIVSRIQVTAQAAVNTANQEEIDNDIAIVAEDEYSDDDEELVPGDEEQQEMAKNVGVTRREILAMRKRRQKAKSHLRNRKFTVGFHHGKLNVLTANFKFPDMTVPLLLTNWLTGNQKDNIPPYWTLTTDNVKHIKNGSSELVMMRATMSVIEKMGRMKGTWLNDMKKWDYISVNKLWRSISADIKKEYQGKRTKRKTEAKWRTIYNNMSAKNAFGNKRNKLVKQSVLSSENKDESTGDVQVQNNNKEEETDFDGFEIGNSGEVPVASTKAATATATITTPTITSLQPRTNFVTTRRTKTTRQTQMNSFVTTRSKDTNNNKKKRKMPESDTESNSDSDDLQKKTKKHVKDIEVPLGGDDSSNTSYDTDDLYA